MANNDGTSTTETLDNDTSSSTEPTNHFATREELHALLDNVREQERNKQKKEVEKAKAAQKALAEQIEAQKTEMARLKASLENKVDLPQPEPVADPTNVELMEKLAAFEQRLEAQKLASEQEKTALELKLKEQSKATTQLLDKRELDRYKSQQLAKEGISPAMAKLVEGTTPEEVDASIVEVKAEVDRIKDESRKAIMDEFAADLPSGNVPEGYKRQVTASSRRSFADMREAAKSPTFVEDQRKRLQELFQ